MSDTAELGTNQDAAQPPGVQSTNPQGNAPGVGESQDQGNSGQSDGDQSLNGEEGEEPKAPELEEVEFDGKKYAIPKELKPALMKDADYTRKTQEHAEQVRQAEAQFAQREQALAYQAQVQQQHIAQYAQVAALDQQLSQYQSINWQQAMQTDPQATQAAWMQFQQVKEQRAGVVQGLQQSEQRFAQQRQQAQAQEFERSTNAVKAVVSKWAPEVVAAVNDIGEKAYGVRAEHLGFFATNPGLLPILHDAVQYRMLMTKADKATKPAAANSQPAVIPTPTLSAGGQATPRGLDDRVTSDEWMKRRNAQLSKQRTR